MNGGLREPLAEAHAARVRHLFALDAANVMRRVARRREEMPRLFGVTRNRAVLLEPLRSVATSSSFADLVVLEPREQAAVVTFGEALDTLRWYVAWTEDMPGTLADALDAHLRVLDAAYAALCEVLPAVPSDEAATAEELVAEAFAAAEARAKAAGRG